MNGEGDSRKRKSNGVIGDNAGKRLATDQSFSQRVPNASQMYLVDSDSDKSDYEDIDSRFDDYKIRVAKEEAEKKEKALIRVEALENCYESLNDLQKSLLSTTELKIKEGDWQKRLIAQLPVYYAGIYGCRSIKEYTNLNKIQEGTFGIVYRSQCVRTEEIVAIKALKMEKENDGFPITSIREINMLLKCGSHPNIVNVREIVVGDSMNEIFMVMEYVEHDVKFFLDNFKKKNSKLTISEVKCLMYQLLEGINHMHKHWILHRDLKPSNLLINHNGVMKIGDFGLAREYGEPLKPYTSVVVTLWYRSPELLMSTKLYSKPIDMWSCGCIFGEFLTLRPLFCGQVEIDQLKKIFSILGSPTPQIWPDFFDFPYYKALGSDIHRHKLNELSKHVGKNKLSDVGFRLLNKFLFYNPENRISAEAALQHEWFKEEPRMCLPSDIQTFPAQIGVGRESKKMSKANEKLDHEFIGQDKELLEAFKVKNVHKERTFVLK
uniref:Protein kinase domain-containing protein n=1 Tax=Rhabditophanes sp. KR3021 TaxID=114890 RepID=A0AC35UB68_9BILA